MVMRMLVLVAGIKYRLADGGDNYGRVEMAIDNKWGTICDLHFDNKDADVACRYFNFTSGVCNRRVWVLGDRFYINYQWV